MSGERGWNPQVIFGLAIVAFGLILTAANLGWYEARYAFRFLPLLFSVWGLSIALDREAHGSRRWFGWVLVTVGLWWTANLAFGLRIYIDDWWPVGLIALGIFLILRSSSRGATDASGAGDGGATGSGTSGGSMDAPFGTSGFAASPVSADPPPADAAREEVTSAMAFMSGVKRNIVSPRFRRATLTAVMGGVEIDMRQCTATGGESVIDVFAMWGGIGIRVPHDWQVVSEANAVLGGVEDSAAHVQPFRHRLVIKGLVIMGGVEVKS